MRRDILISKKTKKRIRKNRRRKPFSTRFDDDDFHASWMFVCFPICIFVNKNEIVLLSKQNHRKKKEWQRKLSDIFKKQTNKKIFGRILNILKIAQRKFKF